MNCFIFVSYEINLNYRDARLVGGEHQLFE